MDTTDLQAWLLPQITIDEVAAEADLTNFGRPPIGSAHQEIWQPLRVLAECHAKREALILATAAVEAATRSTSDTATQDFMNALVQIIAVPYADRPGYQLGWWPELHHNA